MAHHIINVTLVETPVDPEAADVLQSQNPLHTVPGDTVEWIFSNAQGQVQGLRVEFRGFVPEDRGITISGPGRHPFTTPPSATVPTTGRFTIADTDRGIYFYAIFRGNQEIKWAVPLFRTGSFNVFFGGIIIRDPQSIRGPRD